MLDRQLRPLKDRLLAPVARLLGGRIHPHALTILALLSGLVAAIEAGRTRYPAALLWWWVSRFFDGLDGVCARRDGRQSDFGGYLDIVFDFAVYAAIPIGLAIGAESDGVNRAALFLLASFLVNAASWMYLAAILERRDRGARAGGETTTVTMPDGLIAGVETMLFYSLFFLFPSHLAELFTAMAVLVGLTAAQRVAWAGRRL